MIVFPNAKINIGLNITEKRPDGFHNLETIFLPVGWRDALEYVVGNEVHFSSSGIPISGDPEANLVMKAYRLLQRDFDLPSLKIHLHKQIPFGAGLGGGSSDAAFMLSMLNRQFELNLSKDDLELYAAKLGSDCAFLFAIHLFLLQEKGKSWNLSDLLLTIGSYCLSNHLSKFQPSKPFS